MIQPVPIICCSESSEYYSLHLSDPWGMKRDAHEFFANPDPVPIVAHPPCRSWGRWKHRAKPRPGERELAIKAVHHIQKYGGVLEHPEASDLFDSLPPVGGFPDEHGGFTVKLDQCNFGHPCRKRTLLYIVGVKAHPKILGYKQPTHVVSTSKRNGVLPEAPLAWREKTPTLFAQWLIALACDIQIERKKAV